MIVVHIYIALGTFIGPIAVKKLFSSHPTHSLAIWSADSTETQLYVTFSTLSFLGNIITFSPLHYSCSSELWKPLLCQSVLTTDSNVALKQRPLKQRSSVLFRVSTVQSWDKRGSASGILITPINRKGSAIVTWPSRIRFQARDKSNSLTHCNNSGSGFISGRHQPWDLSEH